jgi:hypothetical protein
MRAALSIGSETVAVAVRSRILALSTADLVVDHV